MSSAVIVVDDSRLIRQQVARAMVAEGFTVIEAADGVEALAKLDAAPGARLIVCDVNMPRMSGIEFLEAMPRREGALAVPVIMLTTEGQDEMIQRAKALGAKAWLLKPFRAELLVAAAKRLALAT